MDLHVVWHHQKKWITAVSVFLVFGWAIYLTKFNQGAFGERWYPPSAISFANDATEGELTLLTYNVAGLPQLISAAESPRAASMKEIGQKINAFDIVNVQEDFHYHNELYYAGNRHTYRTRHKTSIPYGDGLNTLSKYPILFTKRIAWKDCHGTDCLAEKGFSVARIQLANDVMVDVYNVHATSQDHDAAASARRRNIKQLSAYINEHSAGQALLVMGDFNAHYAANWDNLLDFTQATAVQDVWLSMWKNGITPGVHENFASPEKLALTDTCESIDKIFFRSSNHIEFTPRSYKIEKQRFFNRTGQSLSDHCAVSFTMTWKKKSNDLLLKSQLTASMH
ncbi:endonuclease/exonuclease/phosphatase family protein [Sphingobacterium paludis]|uniref:Endonuclease/exonuclease/phosphatase family metal-dependent hydrolase n=1 Tax=Sphingobacterium paludis TaxID=1476465 RepID=A0A4R7DC29_9SPHI|nr:endonuclease/exonuclease/phosphatase family protein [Sphingobacterium paludis]TDS17474.1 endonuclease/exonuclease/phosphatase family metal-dependent hydrolase [Sphingobacterium paludis]